MKISKINIKKVKWVINNLRIDYNPFVIILKIIYWECIRISNREIQYIYDDNIKIKLFPNDGVARLTYYFNYHEPEIFKFLNRYLSPGMTFCDIGSNIGLYSLFASKRVGNNGRVFSFEPQEQTYQRIIESIKVNNFKNIHVEQMAIGMKNSYCNILIDDDSAKSHITNDKNNKKVLSKIKMIRFDDFYRYLKNKRIDYIKIDVEGYEYFVLIGMKRLLKKLPPKIIQLELYDRLLIQQKSNKEDVYKLLIKYKYIFKKINSNGRFQNCDLFNLNGDVFAFHESYFSKK